MHLLSCIFCCCHEEETLEMSSKKQSFPKIVIQVRKVFYVNLLKHVSIMCFDMRNFYYLSSQLDLNLLGANSYCVEGKKWDCSTDTGSEIEERWHLRFLYFFHFKENFHLLKDVESATKSENIDAVDKKKERTKKVSIRKKSIPILDQEEGKEHNISTVIEVN